MCSGPRCGRRGETVRRPDRQASGSGQRRVLFRAQSDVVRLFERGGRRVQRARFVLVSGRLSWPVQGGGWSRPEGQTVPCALRLECQSCYVDHLRLVSRASTTDMARRRAELGVALAADRRFTGRIFLSPWNDSLCFPGFVCWRKPVCGSCGECGEDGKARRLVRAFLREQLRNLQWVASWLARMPRG